MLISVLDTRFGVGIRDAKCLVAKLGSKHLEVAPKTPRPNSKPLEKSESTITSLEALKT